jgi:hypothetical protein
MTEAEYARKLAELDRLLNDPDVPMQPARVWALLAENAQHQLTDASSQQLLSSAKSQLECALLPRFPQKE